MCCYVTFEGGLSDATNVTLNAMFLYMYVGHVW